MNLTLVREDRLFCMSLPDEVAGKHWLYDLDTSKKRRKLAGIEAKEGAWTISPFGKFALLDSAHQETKQLPLSSKDSPYILRTPDATNVVLLVESPTTQSKSFTKVGFSGDIELSIGNTSSSQLSFKSPLISPRHAVLSYQNELFSLVDTDSESHGVFVNGRAIPKNTALPLRFGDVVFIMGLKIAIGSRFIAFNNPEGAVTLKKHPAQVPYTPQEATELEELLEEDDDSTSYFFRSPRIKRDIEQKTIEVEAPPQKQKKDESPAILKIGPSIGMALGSSMMGVFMVTNLLSTQATGNPAAIQSAQMRAIPMLGMMVVMILGAVLWPNLSRRYEKKKVAREERKRTATYAEYLDKIKTVFIDETALQKQILEENRITLAECLNRTFHQDRRLFERTALQSDFLELRCGRGDIPLYAEARFPPDKLSLDEDVLKSLVKDLSEKPRLLEDVPLSLSLQEDYVCGVVGNSRDYYPFMRGLIAQICSLHAPDEVKIVLFGDKEDEKEWEFARALPHIFDQSYQMRFLATDRIEALEVSLRLERELQQRLAASGVEQPGDYGIYYVVLVANKELASKTESLESLNELRSNKGFSVITFAEDIRELPKECRRIIELTDVKGVSYDPKDASGERLAFTSDISLPVEQASDFSEALAEIKLELESARTSLPKSLGFLEMFEAGKVEHLNILTRWRENNPCLSLQTPLGVDPYGTLALLDIHEDFHGPHGLVAGMTGSGKSEFIITYILSLAVNYRPDEVSFVLIDYKGGGLVGAFDNVNARLPHLAGTITNLDGAAIIRSMVSINSELRRRQDVFNQARDIAGESTMDIYKYQALYREGRVEEPMPHLVIISDEFAELKSQQPEFMDELISAARIGRSLGVHLILATQKPSGVVNDQIWSNSKFKVCLKVADAADSREMLKRPDAAELVEAGRYYLQVGFNEYFAMGQSAYAGVRYVVQEEFEPKQDNSVVLINNNGRPLLAMKPSPPQQEGAKIPEARAVLEHIAELAKQLELTAPKLWIDSIPAHITLKELEERYPLKTQPFILNPVVGEYDDPANQRQGPLTLPLSENGNTILYGAVGSGVETILNTLLFSLISKHDAKEVNIYIMDFGAETLGLFKKAPQVGDVLFSGDEEKVGRLFDVLQKEIMRRKRILSASGRTFNSYNQELQETQETLPNIVVILNDILAFYDLYAKLEDRLNTLTREANRYGISFVITAASANAARMRLRSNFKQNLVVSFNDQTDYVAILGSMRGVPLPQGYARGLAARDAIFEYQGAFVCAIDEVESIALREGIAELRANQEQEHKAPSIPLLPSQVTRKHLFSNLLSDSLPASAIPFALFEQTLEPVALTFEDSPFTRCAFNKPKDGMAFLKPFLTLLGENQSYYEPTLLDFAGILTTKLDFSGRIICDDTEAIEFFERLIEYRSAPPAKKQLVLLSGIGSWLIKIAPDKSNTIKSYLKALKENEGAVFFLFDTTSTSTYNNEEWFKTQLGPKNGLWLGDGLSSQTSFTINYGAGQTVDPTVRGDRGYNIVDGMYTAIKYLTSTD